MSKNTLVVVFAGANGSGKSSITREISSDENFPELYINADEIARSLPIEKYPSEYSRNKLAAEIAAASRNKALTDNSSFAFETVLSTPGNVSLLQKAKAGGFNIKAHIVVTETSDINVDRVKIRAEEGGHDVPENSIRDRYLRSMKLQAIILEISDDVTVYDNSIDNTAPTIVIEKQNDTIGFPVESWAKTHFLDLIREREISRTKILQSFATASDAVTHDNNDYAGPIVAESKYHFAQDTSSGIIIHDKLMSLDSKGRFLTDLKTEPTARVSRNQDTTLIRESNVTISYNYIGGKNISDINSLKSTRNSEHGR